MRDFGSFHSGDAVQLNSGGPVMIVDRVNIRAGRVMRCKWYEGLTLHQEIFCVDDVHHCVAGSVASSKSGLPLRE